MITAADDSFHDRDSNLYWNESTWFGFRMPERQLALDVFMYYRPNMNFMAAGPVVWDPSGELMWNCRHYDFNWLQEIPPNADGIVSVRSPNGTSIERLIPLQQYRLTYATEECEFDLVFDGFGEPREDVPPKTGPSADVGKGHYDQPGTMSGHLRLGEEVIEVDSAVAFRDRSWGPRNPKMGGRGLYLWGIFDADNWFTISLGEDNGVDRVHTGHLMRDGLYGALTSGTGRIIDRDGPRLARYAVQVTDEHGREVEIDGRAFAHLAIEGNPGWWWWQNPYVFQYDKGEAVGDVSEGMPRQQLRSMIRQHPGTLGRTISQKAE